MTPAEQARDSAMHFEGVKVAYRQTKDGVVISLVVHPQEVPEQLATSDLGTRYVVALVQIGDDEKPVPPAEKEKVSDRRLTPAQPQPIPPAGAKLSWNDVQPAAQSGIRCGEPTFRAFLSEVYGMDTSDKLKTEQAVRIICCVNSRVEFGTDHRKRVLWKHLDTGYQAWLARERVGA